MTKQLIDLGILSDDGNGDALRLGGQKINENFTEVYSSINNILTVLQPSSVQILPFPVGTVIHIPYSVDLVGSVWQDPSGWYWLSPIGLTIGNTLSGAAFANTMAEQLFIKLWDNVGIDGWDILTSTGVSSTKGTSALDDWGDNKRISIPDMRGRAIVGAGQAPGLTNKPIGTRGGAETHALTEAENGPHTHNSGRFQKSSKEASNFGLTVTGAFANRPLVATSINDGAGSFGELATGNAGAGSPHNNMQPWKAYQELWFLGVKGGEGGEGGGGSIDLPDYETSDQLDARDTANRNRANHTGTQPANTLTGLQTAVEAFTALVVIVEESDYPVSPDPNILYVVIPDA